MTEKWDYANLSKLAKEYGGPEKLLETIEDVSERNGEKKGFVEGGLITAGILFGVHGIRKLINYFKKNKEDKQKLAEAKKEIIDGINEYDKEHPSEEGSSSKEEYGD